MSIFKGCRLTGRALATAALFVAQGSVAYADVYPSKTITLVVPQAAGGSTDAISRMWAQYASSKLGQPVIVDNRPGAGGAIAVQAVMQQPAEGYSVLSAGVSQMVLNKFAYKSLPYSPEKDLKGIGLLTTTPFLLTASKESGIRSLEDLVRIAKEKPGSLNYATAGLGNSTHVVVELLQQQLGVQMTSVPYTGEAAGITALMGGQVQLMAPTMGTGAPFAKAGKTIPLVILGGLGNPNLPTVPKAADKGLKNFAGIGWLGLAVRAGTPPGVVTRLHSITAEFLKDPEVIKRLAALEVEPMPGPPDAFDKKIAADTELWGAVLKNIDLANK